MHVTFVLSEKMNPKDKIFYKKASINCGGRLLSLDQPLIMGILNVTPDSFFDGGRYSTTDACLHRAESMLGDGADIIDIGAQSTRPGADWLLAETELERLHPVVDAIRKRWPDVVLSVDTFYARVAAEMADNYGIQIVNDISAGRFDTEMFTTMAKYKLAAILMHMDGTPQTMQQQPRYNNVLAEVIGFLAQQQRLALDAGVKDVIVDPGFGFGKSMEHNFTLLAGLENFRMLEAPLLVGLSRKSMVYKSLDTSPQEALAGTLAANMAALMKGADILRVHDVKETADIRKIFLKISKTD